MCFLGPLCPSLIVEWQKALVTPHLQTYSVTQFVTEEYLWIQEYITNIIRIEKTTFSDPHVFVLYFTTSGRDIYMRDEI